ncbi:DNA topoisomerase 2-binding protein 1-A-like [Oppia nitens]|uniref:DNA topoisomerase 2-binding protein 1-A-like n=1 Tax=Oppia nitens TaxID=1686743 RepID=UPI0023DADC51|nr:DNA topoisomerase 2-binding protein 1-A-like [Oppia nitens]
MSEADRQRPLSVGEIQSPKSSQLITCESSATSKSPNKDVIYFIETKTFKSSSQSSGPTIGRQPQSMQSAFTAMKAHKFDANWIKVEEVMFMKELRSRLIDSLFIFDTFDGKAYEYLRSIDARICGPLTILYCYSNECPQRFKTIPEKPHPVFSQCMRKLFVSLSGFDGQRKKDLVNKVERMCANYCKDFTKRVTHLVTDSVRSRKYRVAKQCGAIVVSSHWVDDCWNIYQHKFSNAAEKDITDKYSLKMFNKLMITVSQVDVNERNKVMEIVRQNGGVYSPSLKLNAQNCILLLKEASGEKFKYAQMKGIPCLSINWLYDSIDKGYTLDEQDFLIKSEEPSNKTITNRQNNSKEANSIPSDKTSISSSEFIQPENNIQKTSSNVSQDTTCDSVIKTLESLIKSLNNESFLEGCDVYVIGFKKPVFDIIKKALSSSGSMVFNEFKEIITHVIVGTNVIDSEVNKLSDKKSCKLVTIDWLLECLRQRECVDCSQFEIKRNKRSLDNDSSSGSTSTVSISRSFRMTDSNSKRQKTKHFFDGPLTVISPQKLGKPIISGRSLNIKANHCSLGEDMNDHSSGVQWADDSEDY